MKKVNLSIAVVLLLCTALPPKGDAFDVQDALWTRKQPSTAELAFDPPSPANVRAIEDNRDFDEDTQFVNALFAFQPGDVVEVEVVRGTEHAILQVVLIEMIY